MPKRAIYLISSGDSLRHKIDFNLKKAMSKYIFKTNSNCIGYATEIKPHLDKPEQNGQIEHWQVHLTNSDHTLEIETSPMQQEGVRKYI